MQRVTFSILFFLKRNKPLRNGDLPIYLRITWNGRSVETSIKRGLPEKLWNQSRQRASGNSKVAININQELDSIQGQLHHHKLDLQERGKTVTARKLMDAYLGKDQTGPTLLQLFSEHNKDMSERVGIDFAPLTLQRYEVAHRHIKKYLERQNKKDIELAEVNHEFITGFEHYLKLGGCQHNSAMKHIKALKKVIGIALSRDLIRIDPFKSYKITTKKVDREYLNEYELKTITELELKMPRTEMVRDLFLIQCYTGLAFKDLYELKPENIQVGVDGEKWIFIKRGKSKIPARIPILPTVEPILDKYAGHPIAQQRGTLLPVFSNQKMNSYLKEIADLAGIHKNLTTHVARHTFATTVALSNGLPMETTSKILGHTKIPTTQIYGRILDHKIAEDMNALRKKLDNK